MKITHTLLATSIIGSCQAQLPELLTQLDQDLTILAKQTKQVGQKDVQQKYQYIEQELQKAADLFKQVLLLRQTKLEAYNPLQGLAKEFKEPGKIDQPMLTDYATDISNAILAAGNMLALEELEKKQAGYKYLNQILAIFTELLNKQLWPSEQLFTMVQSPFKAIQQRLESTIAASEYEVIKDILSNAYMDFATILHQAQVTKELEGWSAENNPFTKLNDLFYDTMTLEAAHFNELKEPIAQKIQLVIGWISTRSSVDLFHGKAIENVIKFAKKLQEKFSRLNNSKLWPDQKIFVAIQPLLTFIEKKFNDVLKFIDEQKRAKPQESMFEEEEDIYSEFGGI